MENFIKFISDNYIIFIIVTLVLIFALIGYFVERKRSKVSFKIDNSEINTQVEVLNNPEAKNNMP